MDAVEFIKARDRMMRAEGHAPNVEYNRATTAEAVVSRVEQWAKEHPVKTRKSVFLEQWPNAIVEYEVPTICPKVVLGREAWMGKGCGGVLCNDCRREFWLQEVE